jgi:hypothetical protein
MLNNATESSRACGRAGVIPPFLWFRARPKPPRSGVLDQATLALVPLNLDGYPTPQDPVQRLVSINVKSGVEKQLATPGSAAGLHTGRAHQPSSGRQPTRRRLSASTARSTCSKASTNPHPGSTDGCGDSSGPDGRRLVQGPRRSRRSLAPCRAAFTFTSINLTKTSKAGHQTAQHAQKLFIVPIYAGLAIEPRRSRPPRLLPRRHRQR